MLVYGIGKSQNFELIYPDININKHLQSCDKIAGGTPPPPPGSANELHVVFMAHCHIPLQVVSGKCYASYVTLFKYIKDARTLDTKCKMQFYFICRSYKITPSKTVLRKQDVLKPLHNIRCDLRCLNLQKLTAKLDTLWVLK